MTKREQLEAQIAVTAAQVKEQEDNLVRARKLAAFADAAISTGKMEAVARGKPQTPFEIQQLEDARNSALDVVTKMIASLGEKREELTAQQNALLMLKD